MSTVERPEAGTPDEVALQLQALRQAAGEPSYAEIARSVGRLRELRGMTPEAALPPRTTVYDVFRVGRRRLDRELVADIVEVLGGVPVHDVTPITPTAPVSLGSSPEVSEGVPASDELTEESTEESTEEPTEETPPNGRRPRRFALPARRTVARVLLLSVLVNVLGQIVVTSLDLPIWQDMTGTAIAAIALGPWWGVAVAVASMTVDVIVFDDTGYWFLPVAVVGALLWGYGVRWWALARDTLRFLGLTVAVAAACTAVAGTITYAQFGGYTSHDSGRLTQSLTEVVPWLVVAVFLSNLVFSLLDKFVSGFIALALLETFSTKRAWLRLRLFGRRR